MPALIAHQLSFQLETGEWLFKNINFTLSHEITGLVGRNGVGKSVLISLLRGEVLPTRGHVTSQGKVGYYSQLPSELLKGSVTISQFLGLDDKRQALRAIEQGHSEPYWFDLIGEDWNIESRYQSELKSLCIPENLDTLCSTLSGGQIALLQLFRLFESDADILLLDEPSNHIDSQGKQWLMARIKESKANILLVSHDRSLLRGVDAIYQLTSLGLSYFRGNYDDFFAQTTQQNQALDKRISQLKSEHKKIERQAQINREKAQQREAQGNRIRHSGSQPKILMDAMKGKAEQSRSAAVKNQNNQLSRSQDKLHHLQKQKEILKPQVMYLQKSIEVKKRALVKVEKCTLAHGVKSSISMNIMQTERWHLDGKNGCGKSTLLKAIHGQHSNYQGVIEKIGDTMYLDQHFSLLDLELSLLDSLTSYCRGLIESDARTLLAGIGFRRDSVYRQVKVLSGGEKMKLSMLVVSHIKGSPLLLLDEPDNHLDIDSKQILALALRDFSGSFVVVSHDKDFIQELGINKTFRLGENE